MTDRLVDRATRVFDLPLTSLPLTDETRLQTLQQVAEGLSALGYPGFAYMRKHKKRRNPAEVLVGALTQNNLEARLVEALPWVLLHYSELDWKWVLDQVRLHNRQNRLGLLLDVALVKLQKGDELTSHRYRKLMNAKQALERSRLVHEDSFNRDLTPGERQWLLKHRPKLAAHWKLLTDLRAEYLPYSL